MAAHELFEIGSNLRFGQACPKQKVLASTEAQVRWLRSSDVEPQQFIEDAFVAIGRAVLQNDLIAGPSDWTRAYDLIEMRATPSVA